jgi:hypothetical protein
VIWTRHVVRGSAAIPATCRSAPDLVQPILGRVVSDPAEAISETLDGYERGDVSLARAVADVGAAIDELSGAADEAWLEELRTAWSGLEMVHASVGAKTLTDPARRDVEESIAELRAVLAGQPR